MAKALAEGADYIGVGPVYETPTKAGKSAAGLEYVRYAAEHATVPWFAIGGIDQNNILDVIQNGGRSIAVVRAIMMAEQPSLGVQYFLSQLNRSPIRQPQTAAVAQNQTVDSQKDSSNSTTTAQTKKTQIPFRP
jgi:thiamine-phosphate pyrophosphorylase